MVCTLESMLQLIREYAMIPPGARVLCAVSGGADSVCLLHQLTLLRPALDFELAAAHFNHRLRGAESDRDEAFVASFVRNCCGPSRRRDPDGTVRELPAVALVTGSGDVAREAAASGRGIEETAREMRYDFLRRTARELECTCIATAHTADDNLETLLLHLLRGSGLRGLAGISPARGDLIRPLLTTSRRQVEEYLYSHGLPHIEDSSNADDAYLRNRLRHQIIPQLEELQPALRRHLVQTIELLRSDEEYLTAQAALTADGAVPCPGGVSIDAGAVAVLPDPLASRAVRLLLGRVSGSGEECTAAHLQCITALCRSDDPSAQADLPRGITARRVYGRLELTRQAPPGALEEVQLPMPGQICLGGFQITVRRENYGGEAPSPTSFFLSLSQTMEGITLRRRRTGDALARPGRPRRSVKKLMIDEKLPRLVRDSIPVFDCGGRAAAVALLGQDAAFLPQTGEEAWHINLYRP